MSKQTNKRKSQRKPDLKEMFCTAESYQVAARTLGGMIQKPGGKVYAAPYCVLAAFALEVYLKCLIELEEKEDHEDLHDLSKLFLKLGATSQDRIRDLYAPHLVFGQKMLDHFSKEAGAPGRTASLELFLKFSSKAFIELRYYYELTLKKGYGWMGTEISDCVRQVILERQPDWKDALTRFIPRLTPISADYPPGTLPTATPRVN